MSIVIVLAGIINLISVLFVRKSAVPIQSNIKSALHLYYLVLLYRLWA